MVTTAVPAPAMVVSPEGGEPDVVIIAVTYNSAAVIETFLQALPGALKDVSSVRVIVVDNASSDGTVGLIRDAAPWVTLVDAGGNVGYGAGINVGMRHSLGRRGVYVLNPDAVPSPGSVRLLLDAVESAESVGLAVPRILDHDGKLKFSLRREPTLLRALGEAILGGHRAARFAGFGDMIRDSRYYVDGATADWATGAAMFLSRRAIDAVGWWDEEFFLYSEETDYALRLRDAGFTLRYVRKACATHPGGDMSKSAFLWSMVALNRVRLYRKRHGLVSSTAYWFVVVLNEGTRSVLGRSTHRAAFQALLKRKPIDRPDDLVRPA